MRVEFTLTAIVRDKEALLHAARCRLVTQGACRTLAIAREELGDTPRDCAEAVRLLLDPGADLLGCDIQDSHAEQIRD